MEQPDPNVALEVVHSLDETVARFVFDEGARHVQALQVASHALDARATQVATILFAAAALAAGVIEKALSWTSLLAVLSVGFFLWGGIASFRAVRSDPIHVPGLAPSWWTGALDLLNDEGKSTLTAIDALSWAARQQQVAINSMCRENEHRAVALNACLRCGVVGACLVGVAAVFRLWPEFSRFLAANF
jgi:hypothetical protein